MVPFKVGDKVKCIDDNHARQYIRKGEIYKVTGFNGFSGHEPVDIKVDGHHISWKMSRFELVERPEPAKVGDLVECVDNANVGSVLEEGRVYKVRCVEGRYISVDESAAGWDIKRFKKVQPREAESIKVGDRVKCVNADNTAGALERGRIYEVKGIDGGYIGVHSKYASWSIARFEKVDETVFPPHLRKFASQESTRYAAGRGVVHEMIQRLSIEPSDLDRLRTMLITAGVRHDSWRIHQYVNRKHEPVDLDGWTLTFGSTDDGPYSEFIFDAAGKLVVAASYYARDGYVEVA